MPQEYSVYQFEAARRVCPLFVYQKKSLNVYFAVNSTRIYEETYERSSSSTGRVVSEVSCRLN
jgi:hypothetical protein